jgi:hypothetical protein
MAKGRVVTQGKIWANRTTREILWSIMKHKKVAVGLLRISGNRPTVEGDICIHNGVFVVGARLRSGNERGYPAIKAMLMQSEGTFQYLDMGEEDVPDIDQTMKLRLTQLINSLPNLPAKYEDLIGGNTLSKIRAIKIDEAAPTEEQLIDKDTFAQLAQWEQRSMKLRAAALWGAFAAISIVVALLYFFQH